MAIFQEIEYLLYNPYESSENLIAAKTKLLEYSKNCPEEEKQKCGFMIEDFDVRIQEAIIMEQLVSQLNKLKQFTEEKPEENGISIQYVYPFGNSYGVELTDGPYMAEIIFRPLDDETRLQVRTHFYFIGEGKELLLAKPFMIKKDAVVPELKIVSKKRADYYYLPVRNDNWADAIISAIVYIRKNRPAFHKMCKVSCPYNPDGTHRFKSWKNYASASLIRLSNDELIQGVKDGKRPWGAHVEGGNGSFRRYNKGDYALAVTVDCISMEKPVKSKEPMYFIMDEYLREIKDKLGRRNMPYQMLNSKFPERIEVITYDMNLPPDERVFYPVGYNGCWMDFLKECFKDL